VARVQNGPQLIIPVAGLAATGPENAVRLIEQQSRVLIFNLAVEHGRRRIDRPPGPRYGQFEYFEDSSLAAPLLRAGHGQVGGNIRLLEHVRMCDPERDCHRLCVRGEDDEPLEERPHGVEQLGEVHRVGVSDWLRLPG